MNKEELLSIIDTFTKEDWLIFDTMRINKCKPSEDEIATQIETINNQKINMVKNKLSAIWFTYPEIVTKEFVLQLLIAIKANEFVWDDLVWWVDAQEQLFGSLETALIELVYNRL